MIPFNKPYLTGKEAHYMYQAALSGKLSGNGMFTNKCQQQLQEMYNFKKVLLTTSCTDALEMAAILIDTQPGDEIIIPSYTFVSTANPFILRGANVIFADSNADNPNLDADLVESLITPKTKAIVPVHYAGIACDMDKIMALAKRYNLFVIEDAAQAIDSRYKNQYLGGIGHLSAFSFHETKNIISGEGGMLVVNDERFVKRAEIIWEKGTNRSAFFRGEIDKYGWVDIGSSFLPSEVVAAFLYAQIEHINPIQERRKELWELYRSRLQELDGRIRFPWLPSYATNNAHMFYIICNDVDERDRLIRHLKANGILAVFHYLSLHKSPFYKPRHDGRELPYTDFYSDRLLRLPLFYELTNEQVDQITAAIKQFYLGE
ncbi:dTDP-4-amino-4,6-dideoxygalactose transaminase [Chitinophaga oryzae]|uniref:dTDP-4-amino-4,6-dideoxygalactose transaminase n=1 Tax=Chitinophaga oryzae TaxID=2725414 RepID=A0AAE6ZHT5_9BACT|nr:dTDP-4-amino-4,6-dideoxygalactose transaminase [Chitinophaga oryzae]QJB33021.1 dTDP-4-amino-4,6-dideoxygalactose transaminase [Chitinophaga oryzae]